MQLNIYKLSELLPPEGQDVFCYIPNGISKTNREISYKKDVGALFGDEFCTEADEYIGIEQYGDIKWIKEN